MEETEITEEPAEPNGEEGSDVEKWKEYAKLWEKRSKANKARLDKLEAERAEDQPGGEPGGGDAVAKAVEAAVAPLRAELERMGAEKAHAELVAKVAAEKGVPATLLHGDDEASLEACADAIADYVSQKAPGYPRDKGGAAGHKPLTVEAIESMTDPVQRVRARAANISLYR